MCWNLTTSSSIVPVLNLFERGVLMLKEGASPLVLDLAKSFIMLVHEIAPSWSKGYLRVYSKGSMAESKASYVDQSGVEIIDVLKHRQFFADACVKGQELLVTLGKSDGLILLIVDSAFDYEIKFEYSQLDKWQISKMRGGNGIPAGID
jgi:hypothetical protein